MARLASRARVCLYIPSLAPQASGNAVTGQRLARMFRRLGYDVTVGAEVVPCDLMVALNAYRSAAAVEAYRRLHPDGALVVVLTGTDLYRYLREEPQPVLATMAAADVLVGLHDLVRRDVPAAVRDRVRVVLEGTDLPELPRTPRDGALNVAVIGHLRDEKDPLRTALAVRDLPGPSQIQVNHYGAAYTPQWESEARSEMLHNPRYRWHGEVDRVVLRDVYCDAHVLVQSSRIEGGSNVVSEAVASGLPVLATRIPGNVGVLGERYEGYFGLGDTDGLRARLQPAEDEPYFLHDLRASLRDRQGRVSIEQETRDWAAIADALLDGRDACRPQ